MFPDVTVIFKKQNQTEPQSRKTVKYHFYEENNL